MIPKFSLSNFIFFNFTFVLIIGFSKNQVLGLACKLESGREVDFVVGYMPPNSEKYLYHAQGDNVGWTSSDLEIGNTNSILGLTLEEVYKDANILPGEKNKRKISYVLYNKKVPDGSKTIKNALAPTYFDLKRKIGIKRQHFGTSKGALIWNNEEEKGIFILHSIERFPPPFTSHYGFTKPPTMKGNSFICMTIGKSNIHDILTHLVEFKVKVYDFYEFDKSDPYALRASFYKAKNAIYGSSIMRHMIFPFSLLVSISKPDDKKQDRFNEIETALKSQTKIKLITKARRESVDFWSTKVTNHLGQGQIIVKSNSGIFGNFLKCGSRIKNVNELEMINPTTKLVETWKYDEDESQFVISENQKSQFFCFSNLNRYTLGKVYGGIICLFDGNLHATIRNSIRSFACKEKVVKAKKD